jgi:hypothetical protein
MLYLYAGEQRSGKTLLAVRRMLSMKQKRPAMSMGGNLFVDHPDYRVMTWAELLDPELPPGCYIWDEVPRALESRRSQSLPLSVLSGITEEGKSARDVLMTAQLVGQVDVRARSMCKHVKVVRGLFMTKRRYDRETDEITKREHPRLITVSTWKGSHAAAARLKADDRVGRVVLPWALVKGTTALYDTTQRIGLAGHLDRAKDFYRDERQEIDDDQQSSSSSSRRVPRTRTGTQQPATAAPRPRARTADPDRPAVRGVPGRPIPVD